jgi:hypothetical protein
MKRGPLSRQGALEMLERLANEIIEHAKVGAAA